MAADGSAYAALGLEPGANASTIEQAYKRLIKQHHPDRSGGDAERAAEINRAYRELRAERGLKDPLELNDELMAPSFSGAAWIIFALLLISAALFLLFAQGPLAPRADSLASPAASKAPVTRRKPTKADPMEQVLNVREIDEAVRDAVRLTRSSDEMELTSFSRDCHRLLRSDPSLVQLDRCAAFDDAVVQLQDRDPLRDQGPFGELAVTGRIWSGAAAMSVDSVAIDGRLDRIRLQVERVLAQAEPAASAKQD